MVIRGRKVATKKTTKVPRTRNAETMTESQFWSMIRALLRENSRYWKPISMCRLQARRKYEGTNKKQKYEYQCAWCKKWFSINDINVDHIQPVGNLTCAEDLPGFVERLFCEVNNLQCMCTKCHDKKSENERKSRIKK